MVILGLILLALGVLVIVAEVFTGGSGHFLGIAITHETAFFLGLGSGVAILLGYAVLKYGTKRSLKQRRDNKQLDQLSARMEHEQAVHRGDRADREPPPAI